MSPLFFHIKGADPEGMAPFEQHHHIYRGTGNLLPIKLEYEVRHTDYNRRV